MSSIASNHQALLLTVSALVVLAVWYGQYLWKRRRLYQLSWNVPGPLNLPFIGNAFQFIGGPSAIANRVMSLFELYPDFAKTWFGSDLFYMVSKPEYLEIILNSPKALSKMKLYKHLGVMSGDGLFTSPPNVWKVHRKMVAPSLVNKNMLDGFTDTMVQQCEILLKNLESESARGGEFDVSTHLMNCTLDNVCETILGLHGVVNAQVNRASFSKLFNKFFEIVFLRIFQLWYHFDFIFNWTQDCKDQKEVVGKIQQMTTTFLEQKRLEYSTRIEAQVEDQSTRKIFMDAMIGKFEEGELTIKELKDEVITFFLVGTDTNANATGFLLSLLGMHPDVQDRVYREVIEVIGPDRQPRIEDLANLKYTELVIKETLRLFPSGPFIGRLADGDIVLTPEIVIPKGAHLAIGLLPLHRSAKYWPNPLKFDPDRFLPENSVDRHPYAWLPFSAGPRNCIGMKFSYRLLKIMVAMVVRKFRIRCSRKDVLGFDLITNVVLKPKNGFPLSMKLR